MSALFISLAFILLIGAAMVAVYVALFGTPRVLDDRFTDMGVKMRVSQGDAGVASEVRCFTVARAVPMGLRNACPRRPSTLRKGKSLRNSWCKRVFSTRAPHGLSRWCAFSTAACAILALVIALASNRSGVMVIMALVAGAGAGAFVPSYYSAASARKRQGEIASQLSDVLDLLVVCVEAGLGSVGSDQDRRRRSRAPGQAIGTELALVSGELAAGSSLGQALRSLADRTAVDDIKPLAATLIQSEQIGAQIGPALRAISDSLRTARKHARRGSGAEDHRQDSVSAGAVHSARDDERDRRDPR